MQSHLNESKPACLSRLSIYRFYASGFGSININKKISTHTDTLERNRGDPIGEAEERKKKAQNYDYEFFE